MRNDEGIPGLQLDVEAIHARSATDLSFALSLANQRVLEAERALADADQARLGAEQAQAKLQGEVSKLSADKKVLWTEKRVLTNENDLLLKRVAQIVNQLVNQLADATGRDRQLILTAEISKLQRQLDDRNRSLYGTSSERHLPSDGRKKLGKKKTKRRKRSGSRRTAQKQLQMTTQHHQFTPEQAEGACKKWALVVTSAMRPKQRPRRLVCGGRMPPPARASAPPSPRLMGAGAFGAFRPSTSSRRD